MKKNTKRVIARFCLTVADRYFDYTALEDIGVDEKDIISISHSSDGKLYLYHYADVPDLENQ